MLEVLLIAILMLNISVFDITNLYIISLFLLLNILLVKMIIGIEKDRNRYKFDAIITISITTLSYYLIIYIFGIFTGFLQSGYNLSFLGIIRNSLPLISLILVSEYLRYCINRKGEKNYVILILSAILFILIDISVVIYDYNLLKLEDIIELVSLMIVPSISKNILLTYSSVKFGYKPNLVYRLIVELPVYLLPIFPDFGVYILAIIAFLLPIVTLLGVALLVRSKAKKESSRDKRTASKIVTSFLIILIIGIVYLNSGFFRYFSLSIGSGSMEDELDVGDIVIVEKNDDIETIKNGEILIFEKESIIVVHRVIEIINENNIYYFKTKGDNNESADNWLVSEDEVIGTAKFKIKYIGLPVVWLNEALK